MQFWEFLRQFITTQQNRDDSLETRFKEFYMRQMRLRETTQQYQTCQGQVQTSPDGHAGKSYTGSSRK